MNSRKLNILFSVLNAGFGGHVRTAVTIACGLRDKGHKIYFMIGEDCPSVVIDEQLFEVIKINKKNILFESLRLENFILSIKSNKSLDIIHSFENTGIALLAQACKKLDLPFFVTLCARPIKSELLDHHPIITLSEEFKKSVLNSTNISDNEIHVIPSRINTNSLISKYHHPVAQKNIHDFRKKYSLLESSKVVLRIARINLAYARSIIEGALAVEKLFNDGYDVRFVHIGFIQDEIIFKEISAEFQRINQRYQKDIAITVQDESLNVLSYYGLADVVIGTGRTAFEGMIAAKPIIVIGMNGFAGLVTPESIDEIAFYNFSGRNIQKNESRKDSIFHTAKSIQNLLSDDDYYKKVCFYGKNYVIKKLDYKIAIKKYESLYFSKNYGSPKDWQIKKTIIKLQINYLRNLFLSKWLNNMRRYYYFYLKK